MAPSSQRAHCQDLTTRDAVRRQPAPCAHACDVMHEMRCCCEQGLCLDPKSLRMSPKLLARLAHSVAGKDEVRKVVGQLLPDLCRVSPPPASHAAHL